MVNSITAVTTTSTNSSIFNISGNMLGIIAGAGLLLLFVVLFIIKKKKKLDMQNSMPQDEILLALKDLMERDIDIKKFLELLAQEADIGLVFLPNGRAEVKEVVFMDELEKDQLTEKMQSQDEVIIMKHSQNTGYKLGNSTIYILVDGLILPANAEALALYKGIIEAKDKQELQRLLDLYKKFDVDVDEKDINSFTKRLKLMYRSMPKPKLIDPQLWYKISGIIDTATLVNVASALAEREINKRLKQLDELKAVLARVIILLALAIVLIILVYVLFVRGQRVEVVMQQLQNTTSTIMTTTTPFTITKIS